MVGLVQQTDALAIDRLIDRHSIWLNLSDLL